LEGLVPKISNLLKRDLASMSSEVLEALKALSPTSSTQTSCTL
jgi:hypothetical protein